MSSSTGRGLVRALTQDLGRQIVSGHTLPGEIVDVQALGAEHQVSRTVVREAVKVLVGKGLLAARPRYGTYVRDRESWNHLDPDILGWRADVGADSRLLHDLQEIRAVVEPTAAALAARRRTDEQLAGLAEAGHALARAHDVDDVADADVGFHMALAQATGNELLVWMLHKLAPIHRLRGQLIHAHPVETPFVSQHIAVVDAIAARDAEAARIAMQVLVDAATRDTSRVTGAPDTIAADPMVPGAIAPTPTPTAASQGRDNG